MENTIQLDALAQAVERIKSNIGKVIVGQEKMVELLITALLAKGHVLIEGVPGVAKTLTAKLLAKSIDVPFSRIQFTPDLMPTDIIGTSVFLPQEGSFRFKHGPIFSQVVLIDEINRSPAKTQAALFEVMEERQISYDGITYPMKDPFFVLATQNPIEQEGTYRLPEAQLDRFLFKITVGYPTLEEEVHILQNSQAGITTDLNAIQSVLSAEQVLQAQRTVQQIHIEEKVLQYIASLVYATRNNKSIYLGASPRASVAVLNSSKALAAIRGRDFVTPDDIVHVLPSVIGHRILLTPEKEMEGGTTNQVIKEIINKVEVPR